MANIKIRIATAEDAELIANLSRHTFYETFAASTTNENIEIFLNDTFTKEALMEETTLPENIFLLAYQQENPVGYARLLEHTTFIKYGFKNAIEISRIYALKEAIGKGVGKKLMKACFKIAKEKNFDTLWLGVWEHNHRAIEFYEKWGFEKFSSHIFMLGNDPQIDWLMKKNIFNYS